MQSDVKVSNINTQLKSISSSKSTKLSPEKVTLYSPPNLNSSHTHNHTAHSRNLFDEKITGTLFLLLQHLREKEINKNIKHKVQNMNFRITELNQISPLAGHCVSNYRIVRTGYRDATKRKTSYRT